MSGVALGFDLEPKSVSLGDILPSRKLPEAVISSRKYQQIRASIEAVGLIEPLSVTRVMKGTDQHLLLDGHIRLIVLRELGHAEAPCLIAHDDEGYTYNNRINRLSSIQEHYMLRRAVERGVSPERLAKALSVDVRTIGKKLSLLEGICPEAAELLKDRQFTAEISQALRKMKHTRQVECVELMVAANKLTVSYANAMLVATPNDLLAEGKRERKLIGVSPEQLAKMEREMSNLQGQYKMAEQAYGLEVLNLVLARGYLSKLLGNPLVTRYLQERQPDVLAEFESILRTVSLEQ